MIQFGGSPVKVGDDEYHLFRDSEWVFSISFSVIVPLHLTNVRNTRILAKINE